ncbi:MAG: rhomboid family intramembrane serine protease [Bacteroidales bacterium]|nr:rhomboid family intramembrane serine protease [Bacteroidales bacterium]
MDLLKNIPPITRNLLMINIIVFMVQQLIARSYGDVLTDMLGLHFVLASDFRLYQLVSYMFLHGSWMHVLMNMFSLWMFGRIIEHTMGSRRFLIYYFITGIGAGLCQEFWQLGEYYVTGLHLYDGINAGGTLMNMGQYLNTWVTIGASGACYGVLLAYGMLFPNERIMLLFPPIPMRAKYFVLFYAAIEVYSSFASNGNVAHFAHLGGMLFGWLYFRHWRKRSQRQNWGASQGGGMLQSIRRAFEQLGAQLENLFAGNRSPKDNYQRHYRNPDHQYNAEQQRNKRKQDQAHIDAILDKVRRSGYASLTEQEKNDLFQMGNRR